MKLEQLKVKNFKSYKGSHIFGPLDNFSAIIGENGTGKSNLFDAICFVLGGSSNAMRCQNLSNLIWNGGSEPKSASVSLVIRMNDESNIVIKRKITQASSSLFYINGEKKSSSEYKSALIKIGFPTRFQSYVIFQGDIQQMAMMKPKDLTNLIEELSGSIAFKDSYEKSENEYKNIQDEVSALDQKREELASQKRVMKKEVHEALKWKELDEKMNKASNELIDFQLCQSVIDLKNATQKVSEMEIEIQNEKKNIEEINESIQATEGTIKTMQKCHKKCAKEAKKTEKVLKSKETEVESMRAQKVEIENQIEKLDNEIGELSNKLNEEKRTKANLEKEINALKGKNRLFFENKDVILSIQDNLSSNSTGQIQKEQEIDDIESQIQLEKDNKMRFTNQIQYNDQILGNLESEISSIVPVNEPIGESKNIDNEMEKIQKIIDTAYSQLHHVKQISHNNKKIERLSNMIHVLQQQIPDVYGFVRDLCRPVRSKYEVAFNCALTYHLDEIIVKDFDTVKQCIDLCKIKNLGTCTFLPLNNFRFKNKDPKKQKEKPECLVPLIELLEFDERDRLAIEYVSKKIYFCETPEEAHRIYKAKQWKKIVDIDGTVYNKNGIITGGYARKYYNMGKSPDALKKDIEKFEEKFEELRLQKRSTYDDYQKQLNEYESYRNRFQLLQSKKSECVNNLMHLNQLLQDSESKCLSYESQLEKLREELGLEISRKEKEMKDQIQKMNKENKSLLKKFKISSVTDLIEIFREFLQEEKKINEDEKQLNYLKVSLLENNLNQQKAAKKSYKAQMKTLIPDLNEAVQFLEDVKAKFKEETEKVEKAASDLNQSKKEKSRLLSMKYGASNNLSKSESAVLTSKTIEKNSKNELQYLITRIGNYTIDTIMSRDFAKTSTLTESLMRPKSYQKKKSIVESYEEKLSKMREELDAIQPNFKADESYRSLKEKVGGIDATLKEKRKEMLASGSKFRSIKKQRNAKFTETFDVLVESIQNIYARLTRTPKQPLGGTAYLSPMSPQCPFLDGIIYSVLPPLKRLRSISALSGGEQTLAVVSLIFAMNNAVPAPCFILDEIDAALDKRNTAMLSTFLKAESSNRQIIIVSHRDRVYCEADSLVGICKNISNQSSLSFNFRLTQILNSYEEDENESIDEPDTFVKTKYNSHF